ncbi:hypothetical protein [Saccharopolyspora griseoalba]|uniref:Uncharacterized protein n=1 Tax=Saccharopolyspora griseoalba TaxID=1431848 RepID=A0ABW2LT80_9PSEU
MPEIQVSTSPRATWIWAPDEDIAQRVRAVSGGQPVQARNKDLSLVTNVGIGVDALQACQSLASAGFSFSWHPDQHPWDRDGWLTEMPGMPGQQQ